MVISVFWKWQNDKKGQNKNWGVCWRKSVSKSKFYRRCRIRFWKFGNFYHKNDLERQNGISSIPISGRLGDFDPLFKITNEKVTFLISFLRRFSFQRLINCEPMNVNLALWVIFLKMAKNQKFNNEISSVIYEKITL